jgi:hypothetical protein
MNILLVLTLRQVDELNKLTDNRLWQAESPLTDTASPQAREKYGTFRHVICSLGNITTVLRARNIGKGPYLIIVSCNRTNNKSVYPEVKCN